MRRPVILLALILLVLLGAMAAKGLLVQPPALRAQSRASEFDAVRAKERLAYILGDQRPHPSDSAQSDLVRARLVAQLEQIGLKPIVRDQLACNELYKQRGVSCARVRNVIAMLGPPHGKALLLNAHYDSTPVGPGAADDGIGVATLIEVGAILKGRRLQRPVLLLFNEGEELGLIGARAFLADPLSRNVDSLVNLEARGVRGPVNMFESSRPNGAAIDVFSRAVENPIANSLSTDVYRLLPNYTDVNSFTERRWLTLNLAPIGNETRYHSAGDDVAALDLATLQHMGDQTLALAEALAKGTPKARGERIFMDVAGRALVTLPLVIGAGLLIGLLIGFAMVSLRRGGLPRSAATIVGTIAGATVLAWLLVALIGAGRPGTFWRAHPTWMHLATYAATMFVGVTLLAAIGGTLDRTRLRPAFWLMFLIIGAGIGLVAPGGIVFFLFPPLVALVGLLAAPLWKRAEQAASFAAVSLLYLTWGALLGLLEELLNGGPMWLFAPLGSLLIIPALIEARPLIARAGVRSAAVASGAIALAFSVTAAIAPAYSADRQQRFVIQHVNQPSADSAWWSVLNDGARVPKAFAGQWSRGELPFSERLRWLTKAPPDPTARAPSIQLQSQVRDANRRSLTLRVIANGNERVSLVAPADADIRSAGVAGFVRPIDQSEDGKYFIDCFGRSCDGLTLRMVIGQPRPVRFLIIGTRTPLPPPAAALLAARPRFARPQYNRDESITFGSVAL